MNRFVVFILSLLSLMACHKMLKEEALTKESSKGITAFYVGTYTDADSKGIYKYAIDSVGVLSKVGLAALVDNPSFLTISSDNRYLLTVNEIDRDDLGLVSSFAIIDDSLIAVNSSSSGGANPCFITVNDEGYVLTANYSGGNIALHRINSDGQLSDVLDIQQHVGSNVHERQDRAYAHSCRFVAGTNDIISIDLGTNQLWFSELDTINGVITNDTQVLSMDDGAGPRHLAFHPIQQQWLYVVNELNATITQVVRNETGFEIVSNINTLPSDYTQPNKCADIHISDDGKFLYASNRGHNSIVIYAIDNTTGNLNLLRYESTRGDAPRNFALSPDGDFLIVANQNTDNIVSFKRNIETGLLNFVSEIKASKPVCILF